MGGSLLGDLPSRDLCKVYPASSDSGFKHRYMSPCGRSLVRLTRFLEIPLLVVFLLTSANVSKASENKSKFNPVSSTFLRHPVSASVARGSSVLIPVDVIALPGEKIDLQITEPPNSGNLKISDSASAGKISLLYESDSSRQNGSVAFTFRIRAGTRAWITAKGTVMISDHPGRLVADIGDLDFGEISSGDSTLRSLTLRNVSGNPVSGRLNIPDPWQVEGDDTFSLKEGESKEFSIRFAPLLPGRYSSRIGSDPFLEEFPVIALQGKSVEPFLFTSSIVDTSVGNPAVFIVKNPGLRPVTVVSTGDKELSLPRPVTIEPSGSATLSFDTTGVSVPVEETRVMRAVMAAGGYRKPIEFTVHGSAATVRLEILQSQSRIEGSAENEIALCATLFNESREPTSVNLKIVESGNEVHRKQVELPPKEWIYVQLPWHSDLPGLHEPAVVLMKNGKDLASARWHIELSPHRKDVGETKSSSPVPDPPPGVTVGGLLTRDMREKMVIVGDFHPAQGLFSLMYVIPWSYQGVRERGFVVEEKLRTGALQNRTGEEGETWVRLDVKPERAGPLGNWKVCIPLYVAGTREFRIYPDVEGEKIIAKLPPLTVSWIDILSPLIRIAKIIGFLIFGILLLKIWAKRRTGV
jgi:hypothetical protein